MGTALHDSSVPATDLSAALTRYPPDRINDPLRVTGATLAFAPGAAGAGAGASAGAPAGIGLTLPWAQQGADALTALIGQGTLPLGALLLGLLIAFAAGAGHALSPGHGKTVVAAYLVGSRGTARHAIILGLTVTVSHTFGVFLLGLGVLYASQYILPDQLYPWLGFGSGLLIAVVGVTLFLQRRRALHRAVAALPAPEPGHDHDRDHEHSHEHDHDHDHAHAHTHAAGEPHSHARGDGAAHRHGPWGRPHTHGPAPDRPVTLGSLLALGISGGIIPCPSALIVLLAAVAYHQLALGLLLILAFSLGLAVVLTGIGLAMVYGRGLLGRVRFRPGAGLLARLPLASALAVSCLGVVIAVEALSAGGVLR